MRRDSPPPPAARPQSLFWPRDRNFVWPCGPRGWVVCGSRGAAHRRACLPTASRRRGLGCLVWPGSLQTRKNLSINAASLSLDAATVLAGAVCRRGAGRLQTRPDCPPSVVQRRFGLLARVTRDILARVFAINAGRDAARHGPSQGEWHQRRYCLCIGSLFRRPRVR
jgi:hypothetical protein